MASSFPTEPELSNKAEPKNVPVIDEKNIERHELLGGGSYGDVFRATLTSKNHGTKTEIAAKYLRPKKPEERKEQECEVSFLSRLKHRYIVSFIGAVMTTTSIIILTEFASNGSLHDYLKKETRLPSEILYAWALQGALAIQYLQKNNVAHRDIKTNNFLVTAEKVLKLCDFGIARDLVTTISTAVRGTVPYLAPEVFDELKLSKASDIFSYGIVIWELITCEIPYKGMEGFHILYLVGTKDKRPDVSRIKPHPLLDLMQKCWTTDRTKRPHIDEVIRDITYAGELDRVCRWEPARSIKLSSLPGGLAILANGNIAVYTDGKIEVHTAALEDAQDQGNTCLYTITDVDGCNSMSLGYKNNLYVATDDELLEIQPGSNIAIVIDRCDLHNHDYYPASTWNKIMAPRTRKYTYLKVKERSSRPTYKKNKHVSSVAASNPDSNKLYFTCLAIDPPIFSLFEFQTQYEFTSVQGKPEFTFHFIDSDSNERVLLGESHKIRIVTFHISDKTNMSLPKSDQVTSFQPPKNWLFFRARFGPAPKANPDIYAICQGNPAWYNYAIYKYVWQKVEGQTDVQYQYVETGCIIPSLDEPRDMCITDEGDILCSERGKSNRVVVYRVKSLP